MRDWRHDHGYDEDSVARCAELEEAERERKTAKRIAFVQDEGTISASFSHRDWHGRIADYRLKGEVRGQIFTGTWWETRADGNSGWFGTFQFFVERDRFEKTMLGRWTGTDSAMRRVNCGVWEWREQHLPDRPSSKKWPSESELIKRSPLRLPGFDDDA